MIDPIAVAACVVAYLAGFAAYPLHKHLKAERAARIAAKLRPRPSYFHAQTKIMKSSYLQSIHTPKGGDSE